MMRSSLETPARRVWAGLMVIARQILMLWRLRWLTWLHQLRMRGLLRRRQPRELLLISFCVWFCRVLNEDVVWGDYS